MMMIKVNNKINNNLRSQIIVNNSNVPMAMEWQVRNISGGSVTMPRMKKKIGMMKANRVVLRTFQNTKKDKSTYLKMEQDIKDSGMDRPDMATEFKSGQMEPSMKGTGRIIKHTASEHFGMFMVINMKANGREIKHTGKGNTPIVMVQLTKANGKTTSNTATA